MGIPIVVGWDSKIKRTGATFVARCPRCANVVKMYEAVKHTNVNAFLAISLWDGEDAVVHCGECLAVFEDEDADRLRADSQGGSEPGRAALPLPPSTPAPRPAMAAKRPPIDEASIDAELAAMKKRLGK